MAVSVLEMAKDLVIMQMETYRLSLGEVMRMIEMAPLLYCASLRLSRV